MKLDQEWSAQLAEEIGAAKKACWLNTVEGVLHIRLRDDLFYCEGWIVVTTGIENRPLAAILHGWIELEDSILDATLFFDPPLAYFPGLRVRAADLIKLESEGDYDLPLVWSLGRGAKQYRAGWGGFENKKYFDAHEAALAEADRLVDR